MRKISKETLFDKFEKVSSKKHKETFHTIPKNLYSDKNFLKEKVQKAND